MTEVELPYFSAPALGKKATSSVLSLSQRSSASCELLGVSLTTFKGQHTCVNPQNAPFPQTSPEAKSTPSYTCITFNAITAGEATHLLLATCKRAEYHTAHL